MIITIVSTGKYPGTFKITPSFNGVEFVKPSSKCATAIVVGQSYDVKLFKPPDKKTVYITEAVLTTTQPLLNTATPPPSTPPTPPATPARTVTQQPVQPTQPLGNDDKMSKKDWAKKDQDRSDGLARGNYRMCLTRFIVSKQGDVVDGDIESFNEYLRIGEDNYFGVGNTNDKVKVEDTGISVQQNQAVDHYKDL